MHQVILLFSFLFSLQLIGQINHTIGLIHSNDMYNHDDHYFTNGMNVLYATDGIKPGKLSKLFLGIDSAMKMITTFKLTHNMYTPFDITLKEVVSDDRPYCSYFLMSSSFQKNNVLKRLGVSHDLAVGLMGPAAMGEQIQYNWHKVVDTDLPEGWDNQIKHDLIISYKFMLDKGLLYMKNWFQLGMKTEAELGTLYNRALFEVYFNYGKLTDRFKPFDYIKTWQFYFHSSATTMLSLYDATLMGGVFNRKSPHTMTFKQLQHVNFKLHIGITLTVKNIGITYKQHFLYREFKGSRKHGWGEVVGVIGF